MNRYTLSALGGAALWGLMGVVTRTLNAAGLSSGNVLMLRCCLAAVLFGGTLLVQNPRHFRVRLRDAWCFLGAGVCSLLFFSFCYFQAISLMDMSAAAILLYTAPAFVMLISIPVFHERFSGRKLLALVLAFAGCCLVSGGSSRAVDLRGLMYGLGSGIGYALYSIFARLALDRGYSSNTVNFYACALAGLGGGILWGWEAPLTVAFASGENALWVLGLGVVSCYLPYLLYTYSLTGCEPSRASILCFVEPAVAALAGVVVFGEQLTVLSLGGMALTLGAILLLNRRPGTPAEK